MKKTMRNALLLLLALALTLLPTLALADAGQDAAGNMFASEGSAAGQKVDGDLYGFGQNVDASGAQVAESAILAGQYVSVNNATVGGSLRAAGYQVSALNTAVDVNATLAGYSIALGQDFTARAIYAAAQSVNFAGECDTLGVMAQNVVISGTVNGDVSIVAESVTVASTAVITGELHVEANSEPAIADGAAVGTVNFTQAASSSEAVADVAPAQIMTGAWLLHKGFSFVKNLVGGLVLAVLYYFIIRKTIADGASMMKTRPVAMPVSGLITLISLPVAAIVLLVTVIGVPAGMLLLCLYGLALGFSASFAGCMLGKLVFPKMHALVAYIIGVAAVAVVKLIPIAGSVVTVGCMAYTLGYFIQKIYLGFGKKDKDDPETAEIQAVAEPVQQTETL